MTTVPWRTSIGPSNVILASTTSDYSGHKSSSGGRSTSAAKADFAEAIRISSDAEKYFAYQRRGDMQINLSQFDPAIADYTETIRRNRKMTETKDVSGYGSRARAYLAHGETDRVLADCDEAMRINPTASWVLVFRGFANARKGRWDPAVADFDEEAKRVPNRKPNLLTAKACTLALAGRYDQAATTFEEALKADEGQACGSFQPAAFTSIARGGTPRKPSET